MLTNIHTALDFYPVLKEKRYLLLSETIGLPFKARRDHVPDEFNFYVFAAKEDNRNEFLTALYKFLDGKYDNKEMKELENLSTEEVIIIYLIL